MTTSYDSTTPLKYCPKCQRNHPATLEYFFRKGRNNHRLMSPCKECQGHRFGIYRNNKSIHAPDRKKRCSNCGVQHPATTEYFYRNGAASLASECKACQRTRVQNYQARNPEKLRSSRRRQLGKARVRNHLRRNRVRALPATFTLKQWQACLEYFHHTCAYCGSQQSFWHPLEQEHVVPVSAGGGYTADNIVPACKSCNARKYDTDLQKWVTQNFGRRKAAAILSAIKTYFKWVTKQDEH